uniref:(northern house mosquito) hypothetical protein n=1 Tax=Culex pipiens TaxID=7175 RepID=A0A8D8F1D2_CULPI
MVIGRIESGGRGSSCGLLAAVEGALRAGRGRRKLGLVTAEGVVVRAFDAGRKHCGLGRLGRRRSSSRVHGRGMLLVVLGMSHGALVVQHGGVVLTLGQATSCGCRRSGSRAGKVHWTGKVRGHEAHRIAGRIDHVPRHEHKLGILAGRGSRMTRKVGRNAAGLGHAGH